MTYDRLLQLGGIDREIDPIPQYISKDELQKEITGITGKIPAEASEENQLADKAYVDQSIEDAQLGGQYLGSLNIVSDLGLAVDASEAQVATALATEFPEADNKDNCFIQVPSSASQPGDIVRIDAWQYNGEIWKFEYSINFSSFTDAQWAAINSGITSNDVLKITRLQQEKADIDGYYESLGAGTATNLKGESVSDESFVARPSGGSKDIATGGAEVESIKGNTVKWNQMVQNGDFSDGTTGWVERSITTSVSNNVLTVYPDDSYNCVLYSDNVGYKGHKVFMSVDFKAIGNEGVKSARFGFSSLNNIVSNDRNIDFVITSDFTNHKSIVDVAVSDIYFGIRCDGKDMPEGFNWSVKNVMVIDLTAIFGSGNEPSTVEAFEAWLEQNVGLKDYYAYNAGALIPVTVTGLKTTGFNQLNAATGKARIFKGEEYEVVGTYSTLTIDGEAVTLTNSKFTASKDGELVVTGFNAETCVHLVHSGKRDGESEEYWEEVVDIPVTTAKGKLNGAGESVVVFPDGMWKIGTVYDEIRQNKSIKRIYAVDMGTINWTQQSFNDYFYNRDASSVLIGVKFKTENLLCAKYEYKGRKSVAQMATVETGIYDTIADDGHEIRVKDTTYTTVEAFKAAMSGVMLYYELEEPQEYIMDDFDLPLGYKVDDFGTEVILPENGSAPATCAPTLSIRYGLNAADSIRNLSKNYVSGTEQQDFSSSEKAMARQNIGAMAEMSVDNVPTAESNNLVRSGGVYEKTSSNTAKINNINRRTGLIYEKEAVANNTTVFNSQNVSVGDIVYITFTLGSNGVGAIGIFDANDERLSYYGRSQSVAAPNKTMTYRVEIPTGFSYAKVIWNAISYVYIEKQLIQEKSLEDNLESSVNKTYNAIPKTVTFAVVQGTTVDYVTDYIFRKGEKYNIRLRSEGSDTHLRGNNIQLCEKTSGPEVDVPLYVNGDFVTYTHTLSDRAMHFYRYGSNVLSSGNLYLEVKMDFFESEDINEIKNEIKTLETFSFSATAATDFYYEIPFIFQQGETYSIRINSQVDGIFRGNTVDLCDKKSSATISHPITVNGDALTYTHETTEMKLYLYRYRSNVLTSGVIKIDISKNLVLNEEFDKLKHRTATLEQEVDNATFKAQSVAAYNCANYDRINSDENIMLFGNERVSAKNGIDINAISGSYSLVKLCIFGDIHVNTNEEQKYHWWNTATGQFDYSGIERAFNYADGLGCDFLLSMGDNLNDGYGGALQTSELAIWDSIMKANVQDTLFMTICGNHDTYLNVPRFTGNGIIKVRDVNFITFFATYVGASPQQSGAYVSDETLVWLDNVLTEHEGEINIVICHYPLGDGSTNGAILDEYTYGGVSGDGHRDDIIQILENHDVHLYISGHTHAHTFPTYQLGTNLLEINCGSLTSNKNTVLQGGSFIVAQINTNTRKFDGVVYGVDTLEPRTHEVITGNDEPISNLTNINV